MKIEIKHLKKVGNYAKDRGVLPQYIYQLIKEGLIEAVEIDGGKFIDITKYPKIPSKKSLK